MTKRDIIELVKRSTVEQTEQLIDLINSVSRLRNQQDLVDSLRKRVECDLDLELGEYLNRGSR
jgi:hypothetical protein